jgi:phosphoglucosamine mutase
MVAGLASAGVDVLRVGVLPTPAVAYLTGALGADLGVMLSASHNAMPDNGIKFFARGGHKLADELEDKIEAVYEEHRTGAPWDRPTGAGVGRVKSYDEGFDQYVAHLLDVLPNRLDGLKVVLDEAHGAASRVSPQAFARAGAEIVTIGAEPDGLNINDGCGSTHLDKLKAAVVEHGADLGIAHDGDADRCLAVDHTGAEVDGDQILAVIALAMRERSALRSGTVVATVMSNLGFKLAMEREGIHLVQTAVGDRYVLEEMKEKGYALGGEQSGHVIILDHATTGDGTLTGLMLAARVAQTGRTLRDLASVMERLPQVLVNVPDVDKSRVATSAELATAVTEAERELGTTGRVLLRPSGTEPLVRVMVEAADIEQARSVAGRLADAVKSALG